VGFVSFSVNILFLLLVHSCVAPHRIRLAQDTVYRLFFASGPFDLFFTKTVGLFQHTPHSLWLTVAGKAVRYRGETLRYFIRIISQLCCLSKTSNLVPSITRC
jgi:hypothetical protein